jgi:hypothetical protein
VVPQDFHDFFVAGASASGALIGLLFVAVSVAPDRTVGDKAPIEARAIAASALTAFTNTLFVALDALIPGADLGNVIVIVASFGIATTVILGLLLLRRRREHVSRRAPFLFAGIAVLYGFQLRYGIALKNAPRELSALRTSAGIILGLYAIGVARSWELLGAHNLSWLDLIRPNNGQGLPPGR